MIRPWKIISTKLLGDYRIFKLRSDLKVSPRTGKQLDFYVLDSVHWVNVIALTPDNHLVMVEQYRHGSNTVELEIPGGMMDPGEMNPVATAVRELREETGYEGE
ncbi:MAG: NUDIX hydrolase, partial [Verrucomicrobia bacterium]|nr:NUDIX hydrolase [Verrucomicrobiota bacterium]